MPEEQISIEPGAILEGKVQGITSFGAFIELGNNLVGLVHISEIADTYVKEIKDYIKEGDPVKVKVLGVNGRKIALSVRQALPPRPVPERTFEHAAPRPPMPREAHAVAVRKMDAPVAPASLDDKIARFLKESDERMQPLKNKAEPKKRNRNY